MKITHIIKKLEEIEMPVSNLNLGEFDYIGEFSAKKTRDPSNKSFKEVGWSFRPNYERGLLIYSLIRKARSSSYLEIGFGRGYSSLCAAKAMYDAGIDGKIMIIDPFFDEQHINTLSKIFPSQWFSMMNFVKSTSDNALNQISDKFDFIYIDGDHTYDAVKNDWNGCKEKFNQFLLFDDYHLPSKEKQKDIECAKAIDEINDFNKELIIMDRRIFVDDRKIKDEDIDYGQVLITHPDFVFKNNNDNVW